MEAVYSKLYDKYTSLKKRKLSDLDGINKDQEVKFMNYVSAAEELIEYLKSQNESLQTQVSDLRSELDLLRSTKDGQLVEYQKLLADENEKSKMLRDEIEGLQKLHDVQSCHLEALKNDDRQPLIIDQTTPENQSSKRMKKHRQDASVVKQSEITPEQMNLNSSIARETVLLSKETVSLGGNLNQQQEGCLNGSSLANCQFHALLEYLVGMKLSTLNQTEGVCISALHQSSGYSFSLTWVEKSAGEEPELLYRVATLGTFERVAPEWMRSALMFSMSMCPIFFQRLSNVIKLNIW